MALTLDVADIPATDRVEFLHDTIRRAVLPVDMTFLPDPADIEVRFRVSEAGPVNLSSARSSANALHRTAALVRRDHVPQVFLAVQAAGTTVVEQHGRQAVLGPGDLTVYDSTRPYTVRNRASTDLHYVRIPRDVLALPDRALEPLLAVRLGADNNPLAASVGAFFRTLATTSALDAPEAAHAVAAPAVELVRAVLTVHRGVEEAREPLEGSLVARVRQYVRDHLRERDLTAARIAAAHHVSVRHLYAVLGRSGISLHAWITDQRMAGVRRDLCDPAAAHLAIATVGARWGFVDPSHFGRLFKRRHGCTPNEWRRRGTDG